MHTKKRISIDSNCNHHGYDTPLLSVYEVEQFGLSVGEEVIGYQDDLEWEGKVCKQISENGEEWYIKLDLSCENAVSEERSIGRDEGFSSGVSYGEFKAENTIATKMLADGMDIFIVSKYTRLPLSKLESIQKSLTK
jgi:hypothetical protein